MASHHRITKKENSLDSTLNLSDSLKVRVISQDGLVLGKASQIRVNHKTFKIEGIMISRGFFRKPIYIGASYIKKISHKSFILSVNPSVLIKNKKVINSEGKKIGNVKKIIRREHSNSIKQIIIKAPLKKEIIIKPSQVKSFGETIILKSNYAEKSEYIWKKSK